jgi:hypothetical protein
MPNVTRVTSLRSVVTSYGRIAFKCQSVARLEGNHFCWKIFSGQAENCTDVLPENFICAVTEYVSREMSFLHIKSLPIHSLYYMTYSLTYSFAVLVITMTCRWISLLNHFAVHLLSAVCCFDAKCKIKIQNLKCIIGDIPGQFQLTAKPSIARKWKAISQNLQSTIPSVSIRKQRKATGKGTILAQHPTK